MSDNLDSDNLMKEYRKVIKEMYDLGYEHGYAQATRDAEIKQLKEQIAKNRKGTTKWATT